MTKVMLFFFIEILRLTLRILILLQYIMILVYL